MANETSDTWIDRFPGLAALAPEHRALLAERAVRLAVPRGARLFGAGDRPDNYLLLLDGGARVEQVTAGGRVIVLYRIGAGQSCVLTTTCLLGREDYPAEGVAEQASVAAAVPRGVFETLMGQSAPFRDFVFARLGRRIADLLQVIDAVAFERIDGRLAHALLELAAESAVIFVTQQALAAELGTAREVVSRMLGVFRRRGWVALARGRVTLVDRTALERLARSRHDV